MMEDMKIGEICSFLSQHKEQRVNAVNQLEQPQTEKGLEEVVGDHEQLDVIWLTMLHEGRAGKPDDEDVEQAESKHRQR